MTIESRIISYGGWEKNLFLSRDGVELVVTLEVGPRVLSFAPVGSGSVFARYPEQLGRCGEPEWQIRGGHRFWVAPEGPMTFVADNHPYPYELLPEGVRLTSLPVEPYLIGKELTLTLEPGGSVHLRHQATNHGAAPISLATWGLSVMAPGGLEIIPRPPLGKHPEELLPRDVIVPWPYADLADPRLKIGSRLITLRHDATLGPTKFGLSHRQQWVAWHRGETLFIKTFDYEEGATYPDLGCNFETYTDPDMLEIESLSPLRTLAPGESLSHDERWFLRQVGPMPSEALACEKVLLEWLTPHLPPSAGGPAAVSPN